MPGARDIINSVSTLCFQSKILLTGDKTWWGGGRGGAILLFLPRSKANSCQSRGLALKRRRGGYISNISVVLLIISCFDPSDVDSTAFTGNPGDAVNVIEVGLSSQVLTKIVGYLISFIESSGKTQ